MTAFSQPRLHRLDDAMQAYTDHGEVPGLVALVARGDAVHVVKAGLQDLASGAPMARDTIFRIASMTKPIAAVAAMMLVEDGKLRLDEPVDRLLPELADRRVLRTLESELDDTVPAHRPLTLRDLLTFRCGFGLMMAKPGTYPIQKAVSDAGFAPGPTAAQLPPDDWIARFATLPLMAQPGERWHYHTGSDILGVLVARAAGRPFDAFLAERIFAPLGMKDTGFHVPADKIGRLATSYMIDRESGKPSVFDSPEDSRWTRPIVFASGSSGLVSTADDYLAFGRMMLNGGRHGGKRILSRATVELMTADHLLPAQKAASPLYPGFWSSHGWGFGMAVVTAREGYLSVGSYGWDGGLGTSFRNDPKEGLTCILLTQRAMRSPVPEPIYGDIWALTYQALDD
ncbi:MAG TPA: serine hydrolase domain-containing protein [Alphaproteobacteria bacterium]|jgi:CubicO group peptidase (beta-lactamase class C family)|nr:serine hydrolase domain-containing protein [Alphaproteobacteria bacterium]